MDAWVDGWKDLRVRLFTQVYSLSYLLHYVCFQTVSDLFIHSFMFDTKRYSKDQDS